MNEAETPVELPEAARGLSTVVPTKNSGESNMDKFATTEEFLAWCERYPMAWVVNVRGPNDEMLHRSNCPHLKEFTHHPEYDLVANPKFGFYFRERVSTYPTTCAPVR